MIAPSILAPDRAFLLQRIARSHSLILRSLWAALLFAGILRGGETAPPLFDDLGSHTRPITTASPEAQRYFDQGLRFLFGFNHGMAIRSFEEAARLDPECAMAHWGIALACGPHINFPLVPPPRAEQAWRELTLAQQHAKKATPVERDLIAALGHRYANPQPEDRTPLDQAYADAMRRLWRAYPKDADIGAFFAEALMDLRPWDQWTPAGEPQPGTEEVVRTLEAVLALAPEHPFANHLYIHAVEASPNPERALAAADRLRQLQPGLAHNVHMPSHIDIRVGNWHQAITSNLGAIEADQRYRQRVGPPRDLIVLYASHNRHMLTFAAMMTGQRDLALHHIRAMVEEIPADFIEEWAPVSEGYAAMPFEVMVRFGMWDEILAESDHYPDHMPLTKALRLAARAIAYAAKGEVASARAEQAAFQAQAKRVPEGTMIGNNTGAGILAVAAPMVEGEILVREGKLEQGFAALREAIAAEDALHYDEPPGWILPVRHALGANLMAHGRYAEAEQVYRDDLARLPNNGWSLYGLADALERQKKDAEAKRLRAQFATVWREADVQIGSSCFCQPKV
jgi:tetratricopeptide (TPR) repeat protein